MSDTAKKRRRLLTQMRVQRFRKRRKLLILNTNGIEKIDNTDSACKFSRSDTNDVNYKIREELCSNTVNEENEFVNEVSVNEGEESVNEVSVNEDEEFYTNYKNNSSNVSNFNEINK